MHFEHCVYINTLRPRQDGRHFADAIFKCIFLNENAWIPIKISLEFVPEDPINNIPALVQIMAWRRPGDKPLSEPIMVSLPTHICVTRPQWFNVSLDPDSVQSIGSVDPSHKYYNALDKYPTVHHFVTEMYTYIVGHRTDVLWGLCSRCIENKTAWTQGMIDAKHACRYMISKMNWHRPDTYLYMHMIIHYQNKLNW